MTSEATATGNVTDGFFDRGLAAADPDIFGAMTRELGRQQSQVELIASENIVSRAVIEAMGSVLGEGSAEGGEVGVGVVHAGSQADEGVIEIGDGGVKAAHELGGGGELGGALGRVEGVAGHVGEGAPDAVVAEIDEERAVVGGDEEGRDHALLGEVLGDGGDVLMHRRIEHRVEALEDEPAGGAFDPVRLVDEAAGDALGGAALEDGPAPTCSVARAHFLVTTMGAPRLRPSPSAALPSARATSRTPKELMRAR